MEKNKKLSSKRAITLVALIITIIVMLILVGVSIQILINSDLIGMAQNTADRTEEAYESESTMNNIKVGDKTFDEYVSSLNGEEIPWIYQPDANGDMEIIGIDFNKCSDYVDEIMYYEYLELGVETLIIPDQLEGKNVVKVTMNQSLFPKTLDYCAWGVYDVKTIIVGQYVKELDFGQNSGAAATFFPEITEIQFSDSVSSISEDSLKHMRKFKNFRFVKY